ncbi:MAG TPA: cupin domain-containing protein [Chitinophagaceae bacterium]
MVKIKDGSWKYVTLDKETIQVKTGTVVFVPRDVLHGLENTGKENITMVFQYAPACFEEYFIENGTIAGMPTKERTEAEHADTANKYGIIYRDPR